MGVIKHVLLLLAGIGLLVWLSRPETPGRVDLVQDPSQAELSEVQTFGLVKGLKEISGLAVASETSVFAHGDEDAIIYEIDLADGTPMRAFALGTPTLSADYEGIAAHGDHVYLVTSTGFLYEALIGEHKARVKFNAYDTGVGLFCEIEGLSLGPPDGPLPSFLILCKTPIAEDLKGKITIYKWSLSDRRIQTSPWMNVDCESVLGDEDACKSFRPSGIDRLARDGSLFIISAIGQNIIHVSAEGKLIGSTRLDPERHPQSEGIAIMPDRRIIISDEAERAGLGRMSIFVPNFKDELRGKTVEPSTDTPGEFPVE